MPATARASQAKAGIGARPAFYVAGRNSALSHSPAVFQRLQWQEVGVRSWSWGLNPGASTWGTAFLMRLFITKRDVHPPFSTWFICSENLKFDCLTAVRPAHGPGTTHFFLAKAVILWEWDLPLTCLHLWTQGKPQFGGYQRASNPNPTQKPLCVVRVLGEEWRA